MLLQVRPSTTSPRSFRAFSVRVLVRVYHLRSTDVSHSKNNPSWDRMKADLLLIQLERFGEAGIQEAEVRMGYDDEPRRLSMQCLRQQIEKLSVDEEAFRARQINIKPCFPAAST